MVRWDGSAGMGFGAFVSKAGIPHIRFPQVRESAATMAAALEELRLAPATVFTDWERGEWGRHSWNGNITDYEVWRINDNFRIRSVFSVLNNGI